MPTSGRAEAGAGERRAARGRWAGHTLRREHDVSVTLLTLLGTSVAVALLVGLLAKMSLREVAAMAVLMCAASTGMYYLVELIA